MRMPVAKCSIAVSSLGIPDNRVVDNMPARIQHRYVPAAGPDITRSGTSRVRYF